MGSYLVLGGDQRMAELYRLIQKKHTATPACMELIEEKSLRDKNSILESIHVSDTIILPIPYTKDSVHIYAPFSKTKMEIQDVFKRLGANHTVFLGSADKNTLFETNAATINILEDEEYAFANARMTAEITIGLLLTKYGMSPFQKNVLICGFGRIGKLLAKILFGMSAKVWIAARKASDLQLAVSLGYHSIMIYNLSSQLCKFDCIINTVPKRIFSVAELKCLREDALMIDIASKPYGVDMEAAASLNKRVFLEQGLPGNYLPVLEAQSLLNSICPGSMEE